MNQRITRKKSNVFNRIAPTIQTILKNLGYKSIQLYHNQENTNTLLTNATRVLNPIWNTIKNHLIYYPTPSTLTYS